MLRRRRLEGFAFEDFWAPLGFSPAREPQDKFFLIRTEATPESDCGGTDEVG